MTFLLLYRPARTCGNQGVVVIWVSQDHPVLYFYSSPVPLLFHSCDYLLEVLLVERCLQRPEPVVLLLHHLLDDIGDLGHCYFSPPTIMDVPDLLPLANRFFEARLQG